MDSAAGLTAAGLTGLHAAAELSPDAFGYLSTHPHFLFLSAHRD